MRAKLDRTWLATSTYALVKLLKQVIQRRGQTSLRKTKDIFASMSSFIIIEAWYVSNNTVQDSSHIELGIYAFLSHNPLDPIPLIPWDGMLDPKLMLYMFRSQRIRVVSGEASNT